jgi:hypothetical protein
MRCWDHPCCLSSKALRRLPSRQSVASFESDLSMSGSYHQRLAISAEISKALPNSLPDQIGCLGRYLVEVLKPWQSSGRVVALENTNLQAKGGVWHKKEKEAEIVPHRAP